METAENKIEALFRGTDFFSGGGDFHGSPWDIVWRDPHYENRSETALPPPMLQKAMGDVLAHGTPRGKAAVYIHIPFCRLACTYCAFYKKRADAAQQAAYVAHILQEIAFLQKMPYTEKSQVAAVFFGGGTPGILTADEIARIVKAVSEAFPLTPDVEITLESSVTDMTEEKLAAAMESGVNRFSFGVQSFQTEIRQKVGRPEPRETVMEKLRRFSAIAENSIVDLIYGLPGETEETMRQDIRDAMTSNVAGLDLYKLQLLPQSVLARQFSDAHETLDTAVLGRLFRAAEEALLQQGAENISFCHWRKKPVERSVYNQMAAEGSDIFALGMACGGSLGGISFMKPMNDAMYQKTSAMGYVPMAGRKKRAGSALLGRLTGMCGRGRIEIGRLSDACPLPMEAFLRSVCVRWAAWGLLEKDGTGYRYTSAGRFWHRVMQRHLLRGAEYVLYGPPEQDSAHGPSGMKWEDMGNLR